MVFEGLDPTTVKILIVVFVIVGLLAIAGIVSLWYKFRKQMWAFGISTVLAVVIAIVFPLIVNELIVTQLIQNPVFIENPLFRVFMTAFESSMIAVILKTVINFGFDVSRWEIGKQN